MIARDSSAKKMLAIRFIRRGIYLTSTIVLVIGLVTGMTWAVAGEDKEIPRNIEEVAPLRNLLELVHEAYPGQVLEVELEREEHKNEDILVYQIKVLTEKGNVLKLEYDAINLELLKLKGRPGN